MTAYIPHTYSNTEVDKAARALCNVDISQAEYQKAVKVFDGWRSCYAYPLHVMHSYTLQKAKSIDARCIVSQRLKRKESIFAKIDRLSNIRASQMQDIGGCRAIFNNIASVYELRSALLNSQRKHILQNEKDYIKNPKYSGYRGIHLVYKYVSEANVVSNNNILIETQIRTRLQHLWATSVEALSYFTQNPLKSSIGPDEWLQFFRLVSSIFAIEERQSTIPGTPDNRQALVAAINELDQQHHLFQQLSGYNIAAQHINKNSDGYYYVLVLNFNEHMIYVTSFKRNQVKEAIEMYNNYENAEPSNNVVLVSADSIESLRKAYPNYFMNIKEFSETLNRLMFLK